MEKTNFSEISILKSYGIPLGLLFIAVLIFAYLIDIDKEKWFGMVNFIFMEIAIIYCIYDIKKLTIDPITFGIAFKSAFNMCFVAILISSIYFFIHINYVDTNFINAIMDIQKNDMLQKGMSEEGVAKAMKMSAGFNSPMAMTGMGFLINIIVSSILSAITAAVMKQDSVSY